MADNVLPEDEPGASARKQAEIVSLFTQTDYEMHLVMALLSRARFNYVDEHDLHRGITALLSENGVTVGADDREVSLSPRDRIDFLLPSGLGIEVKVAGTPGDVWRQLGRYAGHERVARLLLVTTRARHARGGPLELAGKPVGYIVLRGGLR